MKTITNIMIVLIWLALVIGSLLPQVTIGPEPVIMALVATAILWMVGADS